MLQNNIKQEETYKVIEWPDIQSYMNIDGFEDNAYLINDSKGIIDFGGSAYFVNTKWLEQADKIIYQNGQY